MADKTKTTNTRYDRPTQSLAHGRKHFGQWASVFELLPPMATPMSRCKTCKILQTMESYQYVGQTQQKTPPNLLQTLGPAHQRFRKSCTMTRTCPKWGLLLWDELSMRSVLLEHGCSGRNTLSEGRSCWRPRLSLKMCWMMSALILKPRWILSNQPTTSWRLLCRLPVQLPASNNVKSLVASGSPLMVTKKTDWSKKHHNAAYTISKGHSVLLGWNSVWSINTSINSTWLAPSASPNWALSPSIESPTLR